MSERYTRVFSLPANLYTTGSPVVIAAGVLLKDNQTNTVLAQLKFRSISEKAILGLRIRLRLFDTFGSIMETPAEYEYLDLHIARDAEFGQKTPVPIPFARTRMYEVTDITVVFEDRSIWTSNSISWEALGSPASLQFPDPQLQKQYEINFGKGSTFKPLIVRDLWYCTCGALNRKGEDCHKCRNSLAALQSLDMAGLIAQKDARLAQEAAEIAARKAAQEAAAAAERQRLEAEAAAKRERKEAEVAARKAAQEASATAKQEKLEAAAAAKKAKEEAAAAARQEKEEAVAAAKRAKAESAPERKVTKRWKVAVSLLCTAVVLAVLAYFVGFPAYKYHKAVKLMEDSNYEQAIVAFETMDGYRDSEQMIELCILEITYLDAKSLMESKDFYAALQIFEQIAPHKDSKSLIETCKKEWGQLKKEQGQKLKSSHSYKQAVEAFLEAKAYGVRCDVAIRECEQEILKTYGTAPYVSTGTPIGTESDVEYTVKSTGLTVHSITAVQLNNKCVRFTIDCTPPECYKFSYTGRKPAVSTKYESPNVFFYDQWASVNAERQTFILDIPKEYLQKLDCFTATFYRSTQNTHEEIVIWETY